MEEMQDIWTCLTDWKICYRIQKWCRGHSCVPAAAPPAPPQQQWWRWRGRCPRAAIYWCRITREEIITSSQTNIVISTAGQGTEGRNGGGGDDGCGRAVTVIKSVTFGVAQTGPREDSDYWHKILMTSYCAAIFMQFSQIYFRETAPA